MPQGGAANRRTGIPDYRSLGYFPQDGHSAPVKRWISCSRLIARSHHESNPADQVGNTLGEGLIGVRVVEVIQHLADLGERLLRIVRILGHGTAWRTIPANTATLDFAMTELMGTVRCGGGY